MEHSIGFVTGATSGLNYADARKLAGKGWRVVIETGRRLARIEETAAPLATETRRQDLTPPGLDLNAPGNVHTTLAELVRRGRSISFRSMPDWSQPRSA